MRRMSDPDRQNLEIDAASAWLAEKWTGSKNCPICQNADWSISPTMGLQELHNRTRTSQGSTFPIFLAVCTSCGFLYSFSAVVAGVASLVFDPNSGEVI